MNNYQSNNSKQHPEHPVRNVFFCIFCLFFSLSFCYLWVWKIFYFEYTWIAVLAALLILVSALIGGIISFKKSHTNYFAHRKQSKSRHRR